MGAIKAGDLVMLVKPTPCCGKASSLGLIFTVASIGRAKDGCLGCGALYSGAVAFIGNGWLSGYSVHLCRLIKIDPPAIPESDKTEKELTV